MSGLHSTAGRWTIGIRPRIKIPSFAGLKGGDAAIRMTAQTDDFQFVADALAMVAAKLFLFGSNAGAGHIRALFLIRHNPPMPVHSAPL
jgi:hypothetical protein